MSMCVQGNRISRIIMKACGRMAVLVMMMMLKLHNHSRHYLCLFHHHHPSCFLCDLYQMPDTGWLLISTMRFARYWPLWHNLSVSWHRKWHQWIRDTFFAAWLPPWPETGGGFMCWMRKEKGRERKSEEEMRKEMLMGCCCCCRVKKDTLQI